MMYPLPRRPVGSDSMECLCEDSLLLRLRLGWPLLYRLLARRGWGRLISVGYRWCRLRSWGLTGAGIAGQAGQRFGNPGAGAGADIVDGQAGQRFGNPGAGAGAGADIVDGPAGQPLGSPEAGAGIVAGQAWQRFGSPGACCLFVP